MSLIHRALAPLRFRVRNRVLTKPLLVALSVLALALPVAAQQANEDAADPDRLPLPRFVSFKSEPVNLRVGPGRDFPIAWRYAKRGLPMEIIQEFEQWRRVRDSEGSEGWVYYSLLSGQRTALAAPWRKGEDVKLNVRRAAAAESAPVALLEPGVVVRVEECTGTVCRVQVADRTGWMDQNQLWGVYPGESFR
ncbi:SH3 domain-containing protein [Aureimonas frigidaquae]|nr:SH3 domain-containing protein [Aureimonas frigidaquae]